MKKFTEINEAKFFTADPSIIKKYAARIIPFYITGELSCKDQRLIDEWLEMNKSNQKHQNENNVCDLEIMAVKAVLDLSPLTQNGYTALFNEIDNRCPRLERFTRNIIQNFKK
jgi:thiamine pyrophosphokinase